MQDISKKVWRSNAIPIKLLNDSEIESVPDPEHLISHGLDFLKLEIANNMLADTFSHLFHGVNPNNTNIINTDFLNLNVTINYGKTPQGLAAYIKIPNIPFDYPALCITKLTDNQKKFRKYDIPKEKIDFTHYEYKKGLEHYQNVYDLTFYGAYFEYVKQGYIPQETLDIFTFLNPKILRIDYCFDYNIKITELIKTFTRIKRPRNVFTDRKGKIETLYLGKLLSSNNHRHLIRIYDKKADIKKKQKYDINMQYAEMQIVTRVEFELRSAMIREYKITFDDIKQNKLLRSIKNICNTNFIQWVVPWGIPTENPESKKHDSATTDFFINRLVTIFNNLHVLGHSRQEILNMVKNHKKYKSKKILTKK